MRLKLPLQLLLQQLLQRAVDHARPDVVPAAVCTGCVAGLADGRQPAGGDHFLASGQGHRLFPQFRRTGVSGPVFIGANAAARVFPVASTATTGTPLADAPA